MQQTNHLATVASVCTFSAEPGDSWESVQYAKVSDGGSRLKNKEKGRPLKLDGAAPERSDIQLSSLKPRPEETVQTGQQAPQLSRVTVPNATEI